MRCINCSSNNWENVDQFRLKKSGMAVCLECGFISYPEKWKSKEEIKQHYRKAYRNPPNASNFFTGQRKTHFHQWFLNPLLKEWAAVNKKVSVYEIGAAYGMALAWMKKAYPNSTVGGTELTLSYRRNAYHEFGIYLSEDVDYNSKHDLIMSYKVAEHQLDVDQELEKYADMLKPDGLLYISVPTWFDQLCNFGMPGFDLEYYYSPDHINTWTREHFENILTRSGFEIIKKDTVVYDSTYLCKVNKTLKSTPVYKASVADIKDKLKRTFEAYKACSTNEVDKAIEIWPDYPNAWTTKIEKDRKMMFEKGWDYIKDEFIASMLKACTPTSAVMVAITDLAMRAKKWEEAIKYCEQGLRVAPESPTSLQQLQNIMREIALVADTDQERVHYFKQARDICYHGRNVSAEHLRQFLDHAYLYNSHLPMPNE